MVKKTKHSPKIVGLIAAFNEERSIAQVIKKSQKYLNEVIVIDDGSVDLTFEKATVAGASVYRHERNLGKGAALKTGFEKALESGADIVVTLDGDGEHDPANIPALLRPILKKEYEFTVGSRFLRPESSPIPFIRKIGNKLSTTILKIFYGINLSDSQCGFRAFKKSVLEKIEFKDPRYAAESEMLIDAVKKGFRYKEVPVRLILSQTTGQKSRWKPTEDTSRFLWIVIRNMKK